MTKVHLISGCANREVPDNADEVTRCGLALVWTTKSHNADPSHDDYGEEHRIDPYTKPGGDAVFAATKDRGAVTCLRCSKSLTRSWGIN